MTISYFELFITIIISLLTGSTLGYGIGLIYLLKNEHLK